MARVSWSDPEHAVCRSYPPVIRLGGRCDYCGESKVGGYRFSNRDALRRRYRYNGMGGLVRWSPGIAVTCVVPAIRPSNILCRSRRPPGIRSPRSGGSTGWWGGAFPVPLVRLLTRAGVRLAIKLSYLDSVMLVILPSLDVRAPHHCDPSKITDDG